MTGHRRVRRKSGPVKGFQPAVNVRRAAAKALAAAQAAPTRADPLQRSRNIMGMQREELEAYARQIGIRERDVTELSDDRLRQNCMLTVGSLLEALTD